MSAKNNGKRLSPKYWIDQMNSHKNGKMAAQELITCSHNYLISIGFIYNEVLGWIKPEELERAGMRLGQKTVPIKKAASKDGGLVIRISDRFRQYTEDEKREESLRQWYSDDTDQIVKTVAESLGEIEDIELCDEPPF